MHKEQIYSIWAPHDATWSRWVKPVLFACMDRPPFENVVSSVPPPIWAPPAKSTAIVLDVAGAGGVWIALALATVGYRPVPLYNAVPWPTVNDIDEEDDTPESVVDVAPILSALWCSTEILMQQAIAPNAPPVFMLDATRRAGRKTPMPGSFDNRSISFTTDFPSANFLRVQGISKVLLVQETGDVPQPDLAHTLRRWQEGGLPLLFKRLDDVTGPSPIIIEKPSRFGAFWYRILATIGLRRNELGGFGGIVPAPGGG